VRRFARTVVAAAAVVAAASVPVWTASAASASKDADQKIAETGTLEPEDLPATWTQGVRDPNSDKTTDYAAKRISSCKRYVEFRKDIRSLKHARAFSIGFAQGQNDLANTVNVFAAPGDAKAMMAKFADKSVATCVQKLFVVLLRAQLNAEQSTANQVSNISVDVTPSNVGEFGDDTIAYEGNVTVALKGGGTVTFGLGNTAIRVGRAVADYSYTIFDASAVDALTPAVQSSLARLQAAL
jgi:hypothetical protein